MRPEFPSPPSPEGAGADSRWTEYLARYDRALDLYVRYLDQRAEHNRLYAESVRQQEEANRLYAESVRQQEEAQRLQEEAQQFQERQAEKQLRLSRWLCIGLFCLLPALFIFLAVKDAIKGSG
ncbi:hypothetical protein [Fimbriiglobus ruber]|uniref:Uncharacterized protein n=1 Tax=Fimbriiglobus ruber TaxID=1908690 RepID=A0A225DGD9_9BACT|nr:hypothetical protein [Fimbriiglobus ruber]OWK38724.1 hypothetical protein FRUB_07844 [Fimbriiglobus ruber]